MEKETREWSIWLLNSLLLQTYPNVSYTTQPVYDAFYVFEPGSIWMPTSMKVREHLKCHISYLTPSNVLRYLRKVALQLDLLY